MRKKLKLMNVHEQALSRDEMKNIMAGNGSCNPQEACEGDIGACDCYEAYACYLIECNDCYGGQYPELYLCRNEVEALYDQCINEC